MTLDNGTLILANYTAKLKDVGEVIETTLEDEAKKLGVHDPTRKYEPRLIAIGEGWVLKGLDDALKSGKVGDKLDVEVSPDKGFGVRDPNQIRLIPLRKFGEKARELRIGDSVEVDNRPGLVRFVGSGRAQIDFNHRYAGKTLTYDVKIIKKLETNAEKIMALVRRRIPMDEEKLKLELVNGSVRLDLPEDYYMIEGLQVLKKAISNDIFKYIPDIDKFSITENYLTTKTQSGSKQEKETTKRKARNKGSKKSNNKKLSKTVKTKQVSNVSLFKP
uniref:Peptidyl-prolyl cis-trans isomerase n=1 Tax=uncultured marine thaumarchaeote KM3_06_C02 TaxID=1455976 RepID=A0A075GAI4_9ARCH|nr:peptidyl-prolyl isomerase FKBP-type [uncultured marine thaumarchaeote KM3_06_C02]